MLRQENNTQYLIEKKNGTENDKNKSNNTTKYN